MPDANRQTLGIDIAITRSGTGASDAAQDLRKLGEHTHEAASATEKLNVNHREFLRIMGLAGPQAMELGHGLLGMVEGGFLPWTLAVGIGLKFVVEYFQEMDKAAEDAKKSFDGFDKITDVYRDIAKSTQETADNIGLILTTQQQLNKELAIEADTRTTLARLQGNVEAAQRAEAEAAINAQVAAGTMTPAKGAALKAGMDQQAKIDEQNRLMDEAQAKSADLKKQYDTAFGNRDKAAISADAAQKELNQFNLDIAHFTPDQMKRLSEEKQRLEFEISRQQEIIRFQSSGAQGTDPTGRQLAQAKSDLAAAQSSYGANADSIGRGNVVNSPNAAATLQYLQDRAKVTAREFDDFDKAVRELPAQIFAAVQGARATRQSGDKILESDAATNLLNLLNGNRNASINRPGEPNVTFGFLSDVRSAEQARESGSKLTASQQKTLALYQDIMRNQLDYHSATHQFLVAFMRDSKSATDELHDFYIWLGQH